ncbi:MAG: exosortase-associated protein EpsI, B-type [Pseudomonadota bacterium]
MRRRLAISLALGAAMLGASALTDALTPRLHMAGQQAPFRLEQLVPAAFGAWRVDVTLVPLQPDPDSQSMLERIYDQTLSRTYVNRDGQRVMLSIAYGGDQSRALQLHLPEVCYAAQGFELSGSGEDALATPYGKLPLKRLVAHQNERNEPITYWITIGDRRIESGIGQKLRKLAYGLSGKIPDGMLVRVSSIEADAAQAYRLHDRFIGALLAALPDADRVRLAGRR